jgi:serine/threonine protein kinase
MSAAGHDLRPGEGDVLGQYRLRGLLGEGAMGRVFLAERIGDGSFVALKVLKSALSADETYVRRFVREARVAAEVNNRHLVGIVDVGEADGVHYLAVEYVRGGTLAERLDASGRLDTQECVRLAAEIGRGLDTLHRAGIVHRDVKPSNVMIDLSGTAALTDFGLAKGRAYTALTRPGQVMGTLDYLAPELIKEEQASPASDIYALGCLVYECLTGEPPFAQRGIFEVAVAHLEHEPADPAAERDDVPSELGWVVLQALAKDPARRPSTAAAFCHMLGAARSSRLD